jgi:hypothetical protein
MIDVGAGMHEYSYVLFFGFVVVPASGPKTCSWNVQITGLTWVGVVK